MSSLDRIVVDPEIRFGKPCIKGTRITVGDVLAYAAERERRTLSVPAA